MKTQTTRHLHPRPASLIAAGLLALLTAGQPAHAATKSATDPVPNTYDPNDYTPLSGGIGYHWTVSIGGNDATTVDGVVGAWSWDEDAQPTTSKGWTHTSNWIALTVTKRSRITIRLEKKGDIVDPYATVPGTLAGDNLYPAYTIYSGWDGDGGDDHTYNNRGNITWAEDVTYVNHVENSTSHTIEATWTFAPGKYSIALGGNSPSTLAEGRQGYLATLTSESLAAELLLKGDTTPTVPGRQTTLRGTFVNGDAAAKIRYRHAGTTRTLDVKGRTWNLTLRNLKPGRNVITLWVISDDGTVSAPKTIVVRSRGTAR